MTAILCENFAGLFGGQSYHQCDTAANKKIVLLGCINNNKVLMGLVGEEYQGCKPTWSCGIPLQESHLNKNYNNVYNSMRGNLSCKKNFCNSLFSPHNCKLGDPEEGMPGSLCLHIRMITVKEILIISVML